MKLLLGACAVVWLCLPVAAQYSWGSDDTWTNSSNTLTWDYLGFNSEFYTTFKETNLTHDVWSDFHFTIQNDYGGNVYLLDPQIGGWGGPPPVILWNPVETGSGTPFATVSFYAPGPGAYVIPGQVFSAILHFAVDTNAQGQGKFTMTWQPSIVPEPGVLASVAVGLMGLVGLRLRRR